MIPIAAALMGLSALGGILGGKGQKTIDPEKLKQLFGAKAVTQETIDLFNRAINSQYGQKLLSDAAAQGGQFQNDLAASAGRAGFGGDASSGASIFSQAAGAGATNALQRDARSGLYANMLPIAQQMVAARMNAYTNSQNIAQQMPNAWERVGNAAGTALAYMPQTSKTPDTEGGTDYSNVPRGTAFGPGGPTQALAPAVAGPVRSAFQGTSAFARRRPSPWEAIAGNGASVQPSSIFPNRGSGMRRF